MNAPTPLNGEVFRLKNGLFLSSILLMGLALSLNTPFN
ncbi:hypothetical protein CRYPD_1411 [uncultured Candidatus Thioglobus sp.]|nr:hypothetical protein CRYPD_1411 [uncultured Candidatus Thioglobus sp.]